jgi:hypothetical protein
MRFRSLATAVALSALLLGSGCCCFRPFHCLRPFRCCRLHGKHGCGLCGTPVVSDAANSYAPMFIGSGSSCDCCDGGVVAPPTILRPTPSPQGVPTPMPPATSSTPLPGPGPLTRSK